MRALTWIVALCLLASSFCIAPAGRAQPNEADHGMGIAVLASNVGNGQSVQDLMAFVKEARVRDVVIDWAWITLHWDNTKFDQVNELAKQLKAAGVGVAAMYRPRYKAFQADKYKVKAQVGQDGKLPEGCEILYSDAEARKWGTQWAVDILTKCPALEEVIIYNPGMSDQSEASKAARKADPEFDNKSMHAFLSETRDAMRKVNKDARIGLVKPPMPAMFKPFRDVVDVERPYVFVLETADYAKDMDAALAIMKETKSPGPALAKITWGREDKVSDEWLAKFIATAREKKLRYCFWAFDTAFIEGIYDLDSLCKAAGLDAAKIKPLVQRLGGKTNLKWPPEEVQKAIDDAMAADYQAVRGAAAKYGEDAVEALSKILDDAKRPSFDRWRAAGGLGVIGSGKAVDVLLRNSRDKDDTVRWLCADSLGHCGKGSKAARDRLKEMAENDPAKAPAADGRDDYYVRTTAAQALARLSQRGPREEEAFFTELPWAETIEDAIARGAEQGKLTVVFMNPFNSNHFDRGYRKAEELLTTVRRQWPEVPKDDIGEIKERAMLVGLLAEPRAAAFLRQRCVPVRMRLGTRHFTPAYRDDPNPLEAVGLDPNDIGAPAVIVISPSGKVVAQATCMTLYSPELFHRIAANALAACEVPVPDEFTKAQDALGESADAAAYLRVLNAQLDAGEIAAFRKLAANPPKDAANETALLVAEADLLCGRATEACAALQPLKAREGVQARQRAALLAEALLRLNRADEATKLADEAYKTRTGAGGSTLPRLDFFDGALRYRLGVTGARDELAELADRDLRDPWCVRASLYVTFAGPNPEEWCGFGQLTLPELLRSTEGGLNGDAGKTATAAAIERAVNYLLDRQRPDGLWEGPVTGILNAGGQSMQDYAQIARVALCVCALHQALPLISKQLKARAEKAIEAGAQVVGNWSEDPQDFVFGVTYSLHMELVLYSGLKAAAKKAARERVRKLVAKLRQLEREGGWTYASETRQHTFNTAPIMLDLAKVRELKLDEVDDLLKRGAAFLESQRVGKLAVFHYGSDMQHLTSEDEPKSSSMRNSLCELALLRGGFAKDTGRLAQTVVLFFEHLDAVRSTTKRWESFFSPTVMHDAYHYYFGAWYAAQAMAELQDTKGAAELKRKLLLTQEIDGGFCDGQISCGRNAGTAMALMALVSCTE